MHWVHLKSRLLGVVLARDRQVVAWLRANGIKPHDHEEWLAGPSADAALLAIADPVRREEMSLQPDVTVISTLHCIHDGRMHGVIATGEFLGDLVPHGLRQRRHKAAPHIGVYRTASCRP